MLAAIDVGSNTVRMLIGDVEDGRVKPLLYERCITRLKGGQSAAGLAPDAVERTLSALKRFKSIANRYRLDGIRVVGTEALRSAPDSPAFQKLVAQETALDLEVIDGTEEARLSANGVLSVIEPRPEKAVILDIGGGSSEFVVYGNRQILFRYSCPLGVVRLAEMASDAKRQQFIIDEVETLAVRLSKEEVLVSVLDPAALFIGTAGTITTLAAIDMGMTSYSWQKVNNYEISLDRTVAIASRLNSLEPVERESVPGMEKGRGDLIVPGLNILRLLLERFNKSRLVVSDFGLLEGVLIESSRRLAIH